LLQHPAVPAEADPEALHHFLGYGYVPAPFSAFKGIRKLPPAHYLVLRDRNITLHRYWSLRYGPKHTGTEAAIAEETLALLQEAVRLRMISDVPLGALLSGGIDSATVVALMRRLDGNPHVLDRIRSADLRRARMLGRSRTGSTRFTRRRS
jgi:asparagine synthase (glutamine-hydrolysing)